MKQSNEHMRELPDPLQESTESAAAPRKAVPNKAVQENISYLEEDILGRWDFSELQLAPSGIFRKAKEQNDYYFVFFPREQMLVHAHGESYHTSYVINQGSISFANPEFASMKLTLDKDTLKMKDYFGATLIFEKHGN